MRIPQRVRIGSLRFKPKSFFGSNRKFTPRYICLCVLINSSLHNFMFLDEISAELTERALLNDEKEPAVKIAMPDCSWCFVRPQADLLIRRAFGCASQNYHLGPRAAIECTSKREPKLGKVVNRNQREARASPDANDCVPTEDDSLEERASGSPRLNQCRANRFRYAGWVLLSSYRSPWPRSFCRATGLARTASCPPCS